MTFDGSWIQDVVDMMGEEEFILFPMVWVKVREHSDEKIRGTPKSLARAKPKEHQKYCYLFASTTTTLHDNKNGQKLCKALSRIQTEILSSLYFYVRSRCSINAAVMRCINFGVPREVKKVDKGRDLQGVRGGIELPYWDFNAQ